MNQMMKKVFAKLISYKFWSFAAAIVTVLMAIPVVKESMRSNPEVEIMVKDYIVKKRHEISLYYVIPNLGTNKIQVPFPISFVNTGNNAVHDFLVQFRTKMLAVRSDGKIIGHMRRFICADEKVNDDTQIVYVESNVMQSKGKIDLSSNGCKLNFILEEDVSRADSQVLDAFDFDMDMTFDNQEKVKSLHFNAYCISEKQYEELLLDKKERKDGMNFAILTEQLYSTIQDHGIQIMVCKLRGQDIPVIKL